MTAIRQRLSSTSLLLALAAMLAAVPDHTRAQQFNGPSLRYPEHSTQAQQPAAPWAMGVVREQVQANETIKQELARHGVFLVPNPPQPPTYAAKGTQYGGLEPGKDWTYQAGSDEGEGVDWCTTAEAAPKWTSEKGSVMLDGHPVFLKGINWYGTETDMFLPQGLWHYSPEQFMQFLATHRYEWFARGMDAPLKNPWIVGAAPEMQGYTQGQFLDRFFDAAAQYGILILLDLHVLSVEMGIQDLWYDPQMASEAQILEMWEQMLKRVAGRWNLLGVDLKNEPHGIATWGAGNARTDWNAFAEHAIRTLAEKVPEFQGLFFVEGIEGKNWGTHYAYWWGGNFEGARHRPIRTGKEELDRRVVYSPHIYGPEVFSHHNYFFAKNYPENMLEVWDHQFKWIEKSTGRAVVVGEWGGSIVGDPKAAANQQTLARWFVKACIPDTFWWCLNPRTKFNGGMLGESYEMVDRNVLRMLHYIQPKPTRFIPNGDDKKVCVVDGAFANARCSLKLGLNMAQAQKAVRAEVEAAP